MKLNVPYKAEILGFMAKELHRGKENIFSQT